MSLKNSLQNYICREFLTKTEMSVGGKEINEKDRNKKFYKCYS